ncbi:acyl-CoA thioesterase [Micrococcus luteus]|uniref:acyl-CoA thioesterase n=1 Tax=Micrococcus luteus TaxID=1270 RepID=UPI0031FDB355
MTASRSVEVRIPLRWADMDAYGHVNNIAVVQLLEEARVAAFGVPANTAPVAGRPRRSTCSRGWPPVCGRSSPSTP